MDPGACSFTFPDTNTVEITCTNDVDNSSVIPSSLLNSSYFSNVTRIEFNPPLTALPSYLCSLPSREIDLSYQSFTTLTSETFPCLDSFTKVTLSHNDITSVNMPSGNFTTLSYLDLSSNRLINLPYSILIPSPSSLRLLDLRNNSIVSIDLFLQTLQNITVLLDDNPINSSSIINPQNVTIPWNNNSTSTANITYPSTITNSTYIFNDATILTAGACTQNAVLTYRNILRATFSNILLDCTCASINLKEIFLRTGSNILNSFNCSNTDNAETYSALTMSSCGSSALNFTTGLCYNESLQVCFTFLKKISLEKLDKNIRINALIFNYLYML